MKHNSELTELAQKLRRNMTKEEKRLWYDYLCRYPLRFRRQVTVGSYILDFYCASVKLAIELDGSQHYMPEKQVLDEQRTAYLNEQGISVLRFSNMDVMKNLRGVCEEIDKVVANLSLPKGEGQYRKEPRYETTTKSNYLRTAGVAVMREPFCVAGICGGIIRHLR